MLSISSSESILPLSLSIPHQPLFPKSHQRDRIRGNHPIHCRHQRCPLFIHHRQHPVSNPERSVFLLQHQFGYHHKTQYHRQLQLRDLRKEDDLHQWHDLPYLLGDYGDYRGADRPDHQEDGQFEEQLDERGEAFHRGRLGRFASQ